MRYNYDAEAVLKEEPSKQIKNRSRWPISDFGKILNDTKKELDRKNLDLK